MQSGHDGDGGEGLDEHPPVLHAIPPTDDDLRAELLRILESDPDCPLPERARIRGTKDPALLWDVTGYLLVSVRKQSRTSVAPMRVFRIVRDELEDRTYKWEGACARPRAGT